MVRRSSVAGVAGVVLVAALTLGGCSRSGSVNLANAYIPAPTTPGDSVAYLQIRNNGTADELVGAHTSIGGTVSLRAPVTRGTQVTAMRDVTAIQIPADSTVRLDPNSYHLLITGANGMRNGKAITLTLMFAHAGTISVVALVTDPASGGSSYFF